MTEAGHNNPPDMTITAGETMSDLSGWMAENPIIDTEEQARAAKVFIDRGKLCIQDLEAERSGKVKPLNDQVGEINNHYRGPRESLRQVLHELEQRMADFIAAEERKRRREADEAQRKADEARRAAEDAERLEREKLQDAAQGELGIDVAAAISTTDAAFAAAEKAQRQALIAERDARVRIGGGFTRALSLRNRETVIVDDPVKAMQAIGLGNEIIDEAIVRAARAYKKVFGKWPEGIRIEVERGI